ncbi:MAG: riboflavin synthase, partial [Deltaproteobacteria bacterium]
MFTGIVQDVGRITRVQSQKDARRLRIETKLDLSRLRPGDSVAVQGCCLTLTGLEEGAFRVTLGRETLACTTLSRLETGDPVNLEPALRVGDPLGGHWVTGHIDGIGRVFEVRDEPASEQRGLTIEAPRALARYLVAKGSVAVDGVSLTVNRVEDARFTVHLIPHTLQHTTL